jgi:hypothetical protein
VQQVAGVVGVAQVESAGQDGERRRGHQVHSGVAVVSMPYASEVVTVLLQDRFPLPPAVAVAGRG